MPPEELPQAGPTSTQHDVSGERVSLSISIDALDNTTAITTDVAVDKAQLRNIVDSIAHRLPNAFGSFAVKKAEEARALIVEGQFDVAANTLLQAGSWLQQLPVEQVVMLRELAQHEGVNLEARLRLLAAASGIYDANGESVQAREMAESLRLLAVNNGRGDVVAMAMLTIANTYAREGQDHIAKAKFVEVIELARLEGFTDTLAWAYHNLGSSLWQAGNREEAFLQWDREQEVRKDQDLQRVARSIAFLSDKYEQFDSVQAVRLYSRLISLLENDTDSINVALRAEGAYRLAFLQLEKGKWSEVIKYAEISITSYAFLTNQEHRLAWGHQLLALAYEGQKKNRKSAAHLREKERLLSVWGRDRDRFRNSIALVLQADEASDRHNAFLEAEKIANSLDAEAKIDLYVVAAIAEAQHNQKDLAFEYLQEAVQLENDVEQWHDKRSPVFLHYSAAQLLFDHGQLSEALTHANQAFFLEPNNDGVAILLAQIQLNLEQYTNLGKTLQALERLSSTAQISAKFIRALSEIKKGEFSIAARIFGEGYRDFGIANWKTYRDECMDIASGIMAPDQAPNLAKVWLHRRQQPDQPEPETTVLVPHPRIPTVPFYAKVVQLCADWVLRNQDIAPPFVRSYLDHKTKSLREENFRDHFQLMAATHFPEARGEESRTFGRSDLLLPSTDELRRRVRFEFKVWGRNDYVGVADQLIRYMTDQEDVGIVYMVNPNKLDISQAYRQVAILDQPSYVAGTLRERPVRPDIGDFPHFVSTHLSPRGRRITIYHFIHNLWT